MQSSGAALVAYALAQRPGSVAVTDLWSGKLLPTPDELALKTGETAHARTHNACKANIRVH